MNRQTMLGILFLLFGLVVSAVMLAPLALSAFHGQPAPITMTAVIVLSIGVGLAIFGAFLLPSGGAKGAFHDLTLELKNSSLPVVGGHSITATATVTDSPPQGPTP